ncbi:hypothetical protein PVAND_016973 [Polypedilum vanderplanki]|uniref:Secreted protein n=1 Tax=Polypedilum vanderplanki TaxID=319348 RepID=A0A9J6BH89_POLVA|nr:hypothetical protein PVAND_016973 [Polypedilum vanderplanki]
MLFVKIFSFACCVTMVLAGGEAFCEPFKTIYSNFLQKFYEAVHKRKIAIISDIFNFPFFTDAARNESISTFALFYDFFINATAQLSSLDVEIVRKVAKGKLNPIPYPLSCFPKVIIQIEEYINKTINHTLTITSKTSSPPSLILNCTLHITELKTIIGERKNISHQEILTFPEFSQLLSIIADKQTQYQLEYLVQTLADAFKIEYETAKQLIAGNITDISLLEAQTTTTLPSSLSSSSSGSG